MPYIQKWGVSRLSAVSPLNNNGAKSIMDPNYKEEPKQAFGFEVDHCLRWVPAIDLVSSLIYENNPVEHLIEGGRRLVNIHNHQFAFKHLFPKQVHDHF